jgi:cysteine-rich repeat protein
MNNNIILILSVTAVFALLGHPVSAQLCTDPKWFTIADVDPERDFQALGGSSWYGSANPCPDEWILTDSATNHITNGTHHVCARDDCFWNYTDVSESNPDGKQWCTEWNPPSGISGGFVSAIFGEGYTWNKAKILARGYMKGSMDAFRPEPDRYGRTIDDSYADGLALSYGYPRNHIHMWTVGLSKGLMDFSYFINGNCPCHNGTELPPSWLGDRYYCDSGVTGHFHHNGGAKKVGWYDGNNNYLEFSDIHAEGEPTLMFEEYETCMGDKVSTYADWAALGLEPGEFLFESENGEFITKPIEARIMSGQNYANEDFGITTLKIEVYGCEPETPTECGDGVINPMYEECDDGNRVDGDATCSRMCTYYDPVLKPTIIEVEDDLNKVTTTNFQITNSLLPTKWITIANVDATRDGGCPGNMEYMEHNVFRGQYLCGMKLRAPDVSTSHYAKFSTRGIEYTKVRGYVEAFVKGQGRAFKAFDEGAGTGPDLELAYPERAGNRTVNDQYVDGIVITTDRSGPGRQPIFTYAVGVSRNNDGTSDGEYVGNCPTVSGYDPAYNFPPDWVGTYYCDAGADGLHGNSWEPNHMFTDPDYIFVADGTDAEIKSQSWWDERGLKPGEFDVAVAPTNQNIEVRLVTAACESSYYCNQAVDKIFIQVYVGPSDPPPSDQVSALLALKSALGNPEALASWNLDSDPDVCADWLGVYCEKETSNVVGLELNGFIMPSQIVAMADSSIASAFSGLPYLTFVDMANNMITGDLSMFSFLDSLVYIDVSGNDMSGDITTVCGIDSVEVVIVSGMEGITGDLSGCNVDSLEIVSYAGTSVSGCGLSADSDAVLEGPSCDGRH